MLSKRALQVFIFTIISWLNSDDGSLYFEEKHIDTNEYKGPLATTASVVRGITTFDAVASGKLTVSYALSEVL